MHFPVLLLSLVAGSLAVSNVRDGLIYGREGNVTGGVQCTEALCISGVVQDSTVQYILQSTGHYSLGWMGMGFGTGMIGSPMVIMWPNKDGSITLSQRQASGHAMPTVVDAPPRVATLDTSLSSTSGQQPKLAYTIPASSDMVQDLIWAFGTDAPSSSAVDATFLHHAVSGTFVLDLGGSIDSSLVDSPAGDPSDSSKPPSSYPSPHIPLTIYQKLITAHAICCVIGFLFILPLGALYARYFRTFTHSWFKAHSGIQFWIAGPVIVSGVACGIRAVVVEQTGHLNDQHKKWGIAIFVLYFVQVALGSFIHWVKPKVRTRRPPQNYFHAIVGLLLVALALYQVHTGYTHEYPILSGRGALPRGVNILWYVWVVLLPVLYAVGLALLPRQYSQERSSRKPETDVPQNRG